MKYSFALALLIGTLAFQCSARPQLSDVSTPAPSDVPSAVDGMMTDGAAASTDMPLSADQVVFDENQANANQGDAEAAGVTTDMPSDDESQDAPTTMSPSAMEDAPASAVENAEEVVALAGESGDAAPAQSNDDSEAMNTTQAPSSE